MSTDQTVPRTIALSKVDGIEPFSGPFDRDHLGLPEPLHDLLFGTGAGANAFILLEASRVFGLAESLETSGLNYRMILPAKDAADLCDTAPYLVQITRNARFVRDLFTENGTPSALWPSLSAVIGTTDSDIDVLCHALRQRLPVRMADGTGTWLRFWDPSFWYGLALLSGSSWTDPWDLSLVSLFSPCLIVRARNVLQVLNAGNARYGEATAIRPPTRHDVAMLQAAISRPALAPHLRQTPRDHWALDHLSRLAGNPKIPDTLLLRLLTTAPQSGTQVLCLATLEHPGLSAAACAKSLRHILETGGDHVVQT